MGYFTNLYTVETSEYTGRLVTTTNVYGLHGPRKAYFAWMPGRLSQEMYGYANNTIFCDKQLKLLPGYPCVEDPINPDCIVEAGFTPDYLDAPVICHFVLPPHFVPEKDWQYRIQPALANVKVVGPCVVATFGMKGVFAIRFKIRCLQPGEKLEHFIIPTLFDANKDAKTKMGVELNLGIAKFTSEATQ